MANNPRAFPLSGEKRDGWGNAQEGMSLRDYFAAKAMASIIVTEEMFCGRVSPEEAEEACSTIPEMAEDAYRYADAMLEARES